MDNNRLVIIVLVLLLIGGFLYYENDKNTATIDLPGEGKIEITE